MPVFVDFVTLLLLNMVAGYCLLAAYVFRGLDDPDQERWAPAFGMVGLVAFVFGGYMVTTWPLPGPYNSAFGEMSVLLGTLFLGAAVALAKGWNLLIVAGYGLVAGAAALLLGVRVIVLGMTKEPLISGIGFLLSGLAGIGAAPLLFYFREDRNARLVATAILLAAAAIWALTAGGGVWEHMAGFKTWMPLVTRGVGGH